MNEANLRIDKLQSSSTGYEIHFTINDPKQVLRHEPICIKYDREVPADDFWALNNALACLLPVMVREYDDVTIETPMRIPPELVKYWNDVLCADGLPTRGVAWKSRSPDVMGLPKLSRTSARVGLLFGGGVESMFALSQLVETNPLAISITGPGWMNNDESAYGIKKSLEDELVSRQGVDLARVTSNAFITIQRDDLYRNRYATGLLFYWAAGALCFHEGISLVFKSSELEEALNFSDYDLSLSPVFQSHIWFPGLTNIMAVYNGFPKITMLARLKETAFLPYVYSCYFNTAERWCGRCSKCYRISEFCERLDIARDRIGMPEGFLGLRETGYLTKHFWTHMDLLYGRRISRERSHLLQVFLQRMWNLAQRAKNSFLARCGFSSQRKKAESR